MAKFQISLLSLRGNQNEFSPIYSKINISEFNTQYEEYDHITPLLNQDLSNKETYYEIMSQQGSATLKQSDGFCYTFNETFKINQNAQKTLTFNMSRNVIRADRVENNPFINYLAIGSQLLLVDKYDNHHLMTVSKISYDFKESNTVFSYECQDSFNYQLSKQGAGYEIVNDIDDINFIGAQTLDWWVLCKIHPECRISYQYLQLSESMTNIKHSYNKELYPDFYQAVPFSANGTADSVLIALGELYGLQLCIYERFIENSSTGVGSLVKYYWFEPKKSFTPTGLKYSPLLDLQSFKLDHFGNSFSSILNISSHSVGDTLLTVLPSVPSFFERWFKTSEWDESIFVPGLFTKTCKGNTYITEYKEIVIDKKSTPSQTTYQDNKIIWKNKYLYIPIKHTLQTQNYDFVTFTTDADTFSVLTINGTSYSSKFASWVVVIKLQELADEIIITPSETEIPHNAIKNKTIEYVYLKLFVDEEGDVLDGILYTHWYRIPSDEEVKFAEIAEQIPWLENKLIDFNYFYNNLIINPAEYAELMSLLENNLRKINARLLRYSQAYYQSIQNKTKLIGELTSRIDLVGALFNSDILQAYAQDGAIRKTTDFNQALDALFSKNAESSSMITYYETLSEYVNKYWMSEQLFLKNMYMFSEYWNANANVGTLYSYSFTLADQDDNLIISFTNPNKYVPLTLENSFSPIYWKQSDNSYTPLDNNTIVTQDNFTYFYILDTSNDQMTQILDNSSPQLCEYSNSQIYYEIQWTANITDEQKVYFFQEFDEEMNKNIYKKTWPRDKSNPSRYQLDLISSSTVNISFREHCLGNQKNEDGSPITTFVIDGHQFSNAQEHFVEVTYADICKNYFYQSLQANANTLLSKDFLHKRVNKSQELMKYLKTTKTFPAQFSHTGMKNKVLCFLPDAKNWDEDFLQEENSDTNNSNADTIYKSFFPIVNLYWKGYATDDDGVKSDNWDYHNAPYVNGENYMSFYRRTSVSSKNRSNWRVANRFVLPLAVFWIAEIVWNNGDKDFSNDGWTYHDVFGCDYSPATQEFITSSRFMYTKNVDAYDRTAQREIFDSSAFEGNEGWKGNTDKVYQKQTKEEDDTLQVKNWDYHEATNIAPTYFSLLKRLKNKLTEYYYQPKYWRILSANDVVHKNDVFSVLLQKDNEYFEYNPQQYFRDSDNNALFSQYDIVTLSDKDSVHELRRLNSVVYYPLENVIYTLTTDDFNWSMDSDVSYMTVQELIDNCGYLTVDDSNGVIWRGSIPQKDGNSIRGNMILMKSESFDYLEFSALKWNSNSVFYNNIDQYAFDTYYHNSNMKMVNFKTEYSDLLHGFWVQGYHESDFHQNHGLNLDENNHYYRQTDSGYDRCFTLHQLIEHPDTYAKIAQTHQYQTFSELKELFATYYVYERESVDKPYKLIKSQSGKIARDNRSWYLYGEDVPNKKHALRVQTQTQNLDSLTNGTFWYLYHNSPVSALQEQSLIIESNLMEYWTSAYNSSKNCKFFIPQFWQPIVDGKHNHFSEDVFDKPFNHWDTVSYSIPVPYRDVTNSNYTIDVSGAQAVIKLTNTKDRIKKSTFSFTASGVAYQGEVDQDSKTTTLNGFIVNVGYAQFSSVTVVLNDNLTELSIQTTASSGAWFSDFNVTIELEPVLNTTFNTARLKTTYIPQVKKLAHQKRYQIKHLNTINSKQHQIAELYKLNTSQDVGLSVLSSKIKPIQHIVDYLNLTGDEWLGVKTQDDYVLYEYQSGGMLWSDLLPKLTSGAIVNTNFGGWYDMMIRVLQSGNYINYNPQQYQQAQDEHDAIWYNIYTKYPHLIYEQEYTNEDATTSDELLKMAKQAFKDYTQVESNYSISILDPNTLRGYHGQELKPGDGIEIDADELYDDRHSLVYQSLTQFLYITDISYDLRRDDNIKLTVNPIKYQDKVIGELIKLIR